MDADEFGGPLGRRRLPDVAVGGARGEPASAKSGLRGAIVVGLLSLGLIGGLWLAARGAPSAAIDPELLPATAGPASPAAGERFGSEQFPTVRAIIRRAPERGSSEASAILGWGAPGRVPREPTTERGL